MDRHADILPLGDIMSTVLGDALGASAMEGLRALRVVEIWRETLGTTMSRYSSHERFDKGTLYAAIQLPALRQELFMNRATIIKKINDQLGIDFVKALQLR